MKTFGRRHRTRWSDVEAFGLVRIGSVHMISVAYSPRYGSQRVLRRLMAGVAGFEGGIADDYAVSGPTLVALLEAWRRRFGDRPADETPT